MNRLLSLALVILLTFIACILGTYGIGHGGGHGGGSACIVKGSYCNCHYCKCEKGQVGCKGYGHGGGYGTYAGWQEIS